MNKTTRFILGCFIGLVCNSAFAVMIFPLSVDTYTLESSTRVSRTEFIYTYRASLTNTGVAVRNAAATLRLTAPGVTILQGALSFGDVPASSTVVSTGTFSLRHDRTYAFSAADLQWLITYDPVSIITPPAAPSLTLGFGIKQLQFAWASISGATSYRLMQNPDGVSGYAQVGANLPADATATTLDIAVFKHNWANALYLIEACNSSGCTASNEINTLNGMLSTIGYVKASNTKANEGGFGYSVALSGDGKTFAVGAPGESSSTTGVDGTANSLNYRAANSGAVYVFNYNGTGWSQQAYVKASNTRGDAQFGISVALSTDGNTLAVGAYRGGDVGATYAYGSAYVFTRSSGIWSQQAYVNASNTGITDYAGGPIEDYFGWSIALSGDGNTLAVGAPHEYSSSTGINSPQNKLAPYAGAVYVYTRVATTWIQEAYVKAANTAAGVVFGSSVALSSDGNTLAVGAPAERSTTTGINSTPDSLGANVGAAYVYTRNAGSWLQQAYVKASNSGVDDYFGVSVALNGDGNSLAVGALRESSYSFGAGAIYVFARTSSTWSQQAYMQASNPGWYYRFGASVAFSSDGNTLAVGAPYENSSTTGINSTANELAYRSGAAYVFTRTSGIWLQKSYVKASNTGINVFFGTSVSLSGDGNSLAVGAPSESSNTTGIGSNPNDLAPFAGAVYLY